MNTDPELQATDLGMIAAPAKFPASTFMRAGTYFTEYSKELARASATISTPPRWIAPRKS